MEQNSADSSGQVRREGSIPLMALAQHTSTQHARPFVSRSPWDSQHFTEHTLGISYSIIPFYNLQRERMSKFATSFSSQATDTCLGAYRNCVEYGTVYRERDRKEKETKGVEQIKRDSFSLQDDSIISYKYKAYTPCILKSYQHENKKLNANPRKNKEEREK